MKIYSMTATFGKLEHETLTLQPGLNIIHAPNEWGKSTWCAFLVAMLYGIDTRAHSTKAVLADKERYAPWSGSPMSGSIDLNWKGRDITIQRRTKGRSIFGDFRAYETSTGLEVPELTAANCGETLLGVEKSVFTRAGFLKLTDLPVTEDKALWRRLNALVTTGDESGTSDILAQKLRDLKNQCMSNRANGLIPQARSEKQALENTLSQLQSLRSQHQRLTQRQQELADHHRALTNHQAALAYAASRDNAQRLTQARQAVAQLREQTDRLEEECGSYPSRQTLQTRQRALTALSQEAAALQMEQQMLPLAPQAPAEDPLFTGLSAQEAVKAAEADRHSYLLTKKAPNLVGLALISLFMLLGFIVSLILVPQAAPLLCFGALFLLGAGLTLIRLVLRNRRIRALEGKYGSADPDTWTARAVAYGQSQSQHAQALANWQASRQTLEARQDKLAQALQAQTDQGDLQKTLQATNQALQALDDLDALRRELSRAEDHADALGALLRPVPPPALPDHLTCTGEETARLLSDCALAQRQLDDSLGRCAGQMEALGQEAALTEKLAAVEDRLLKLEQTYAAIELAQQKAAEAAAQLQRRFAPRIARRAQEVFARLTGQRYDRLTLGADMSLTLGAKNEDTLRGSLWRSDGTVDQLYLALRLAVAEELTPQAPLILDDALVRFDDTRLKEALAVLQEAAETKQVILFTCQEREKNILQ